MQLVLPWLLLQAVLLVLLLVGLGCRRSPGLDNPLQVLSLAFGATLAVLVLGVLVAHGFKAEHRGVGFAVTVCVGLFTYPGTLAIASRRGGDMFEALVLLGLLGLIPLFFLGCYAMLLAACSLGSCL
jgi:hypothetical protein